MTEPADRSERDRTEPTGGHGRSPAGESWERRAAELSSEIQRWLIKTSARSVRDELGDQVRKAFRGQDAEPGDVWGTATTEPPDAAAQAPECAWCPICRAARKVAEARAGAATGGASSPLADVADFMASAMKEVLSGLDSVLSYRPEPRREPSGPQPSDAAPPDDAPGAGPERSAGDS